MDKAFNEIINLLWLIYIRVDGAVYCVRKYWVMRIIILSSVTLGSRYAGVVEEAQTHKF